MSSPNFSLYLDSLLSINKGDVEDIPERVLSNLEEWNYIDVHDGMVLVTRKGINVLEFYLKNRRVHGIQRASSAGSRVKGISRVTAYP